MKSIIPGESCSFFFYIYPPESFCYIWVPGICQEKKSKKIPHQEKMELT